MNTPLYLMAYKTPYPISAGNIKDDIFNVKSIFFFLSRHFSFGFIQSAKGNTAEMNKNEF